MTGYNSLTVANLRTLLRDRGIASTGLTRKQQIIDKLEEADSNGNGNVPAAEGSGGAGQEALQADAAMSGDEPSTGEVADHTVISPVSGSEQTLAAQDSGPASQEALQLSNEAMPDATERANLDEQSASAASSATMLPEDSTHVEQLERLEHSDPPPTVAQLSASQTPVPSREKPALTDEVPLPPVTHESATQEPSRMNTEELKEDSRKRKRRSATPPVDAEEANKKLKASDPVHLKEDIAVQIPIDPPNDTTPDAVMAEPVGEAFTQGSGKAEEAASNESVKDGASAKLSPGPASEGVEKTNASNTIDALDSLPKEEHNIMPDVATAEEKQGEQEQQNQEIIGKAEVAPEFISQGERPISPKPQSPSPAPKRAPSGKPSRYANLLNRPSSPIRAARASPEPESDRPIPPAIHPATAALYIRDFMRPLQPAALRSHLIQLASPPSASPDPSILQSFFLDSIKTHCFCRFSSTTAAARVRAALHGAVWPPERTRKPLFVDFIPEEKLEEWIKTEEEDAAGSRGGRGGKRWEVTYVDTPDGIRASFQEAGTGDPIRRPSGLGPSAGFEARAAPVAPSSFENRRPSSPGRRPGSPRRRPSTAVPPQRKDTGQSFLALDALFKSTDAKPKLYFLPVKRDLAEKRLDELDKSTSRDWDMRRRVGEELRRYTFEDGDYLVDEGSHYEPRSGGVEGRGGYRGRGSGYRGGRRRWD